MVVVKLNKWVDLVDRTAWAFVLAFGAGLISVGFDNWRQALGIAGMTAVGALVKAGAAQNVGQSQLGDAVPGRSIVEREKKKPKEKK